MSEGRIEFAEIVERIDDAFFALDDDWQFTFLNERAAELLDVDRESVLGQRVWDEFPEAVDTTFQAEYERAMETNDPVAFEEYYPPLERWFEVNAYPGVDGLSVYFRDVTDRVEREQRLERYEAIVETAQDGIYTVDGDGHFTMVNEAYLEMTGYDRSELVGAHVSTVVGPDVVDEAAALEERLETGQQRTATVVATIERKDGTTFEAEATFSMTAHGERVGIVRDITDRRERERELRTRHEQVAALNDINSLAHSLSESLFGLSSTREIEELVCDRLAASDSYEFAWIGAEADGEVVVSTESGVEGYLSDITLSLDLPPSELGPTAEAHATGEMQVVQSVQDDPRYEPWRDRGAEYGYRASAAVPVVGGGEQYGTLNVYSSRADAFGEEERDALRRLGSMVAYAIRAVERDRELQRERDRIEFMNRLLRHNLLNSLNVVDARLDLLDGRVDFEVSDHLETAADRTSGMIEFVESVREVTKVIGHGGEQQLAPVDIGETLAARVDRARRAYPEAEFHLAETPSAPVVADDLLGEVLDNVIVNAVQHNDGPSPTVRIETTVTDDEVVVAVADDGPGIPPERREQVFDREAKDFDDPGSGFGLYLVREILDSYDGTIDVTKSDAGGARFELTFQRA